MKIENGILLQVEKEDIKNGTFEIPNEVVEIGNSAFRNLFNLHTITIPNHVTKIGRYAFYRCEHLKSVTIPDSIEKIERGTFWDCAFLESINLPNSIKEIGENAFAACSERLKSVVIPNSVQHIGKAAFFDCDSLTHICVPTGCIVDELALDASFKKQVIYYYDGPYSQEADEKEFLQVICSEEKLRSYFEQYVPSSKKIEFNDLKMDELQKMYISLYGLDNAIEADKNFGNGTNKSYQNALQAMRMERGKEMNNEINYIVHDGDEEVEKFLNSHSKYAREDFVSYTTAMKNLSKINQDTINSL